MIAGVIYRYFSLYYMLEIDNLFIASAILLFEMGIQKNLYNAIPSTYYSLMNIANQFYYISFKSHFVHYWHHRYIVILIYCTIYDSIQQNYYTTATYS